MLARKKKRSGLRPGDVAKNFHPADFQKQDYILFWPGSFVPKLDLIPHFLLALFYSFTLCYASFAPLR